MIELTQPDIWQVECDWLCITTNGMIRNDGKAVMGKGIARQAKDRIPDIDIALAESITRKGNIVSVIGKHENKWIISFPTKHDWRDDSDINLIKQSSEQLKSHFDKQQTKPTVLFARPGCGNGKLIWSDVKAIIGQILTDDKFVVVNPLAD